MNITGKGKLASNVSAHLQAPEDFVSFVDLITDAAGRIRKRPGIGAVKGALAGGAVTRMHEYSRTAADSTVTRYLMRATAAKVQLWDGAAWNDMALPYMPSAGAIWAFEDADNRCFAVNGKDATIVYDGTSWKLAGADGPISALTYQLGGIVSLGVVQITKGGTQIVLSGVSLLTLTSVGLTATATVSAAHNLVVGDWLHVTGAGVAAYNGDYQVLGVPNATTFTYTFAGGASPAGGAPKAFRHWLTGPSWPDKSIDIAGSRYTFSSIDSISTATLNEQVREASAPGLPFKIYIGDLSWELALFYAYGYWNETTGHASNIRAASLVGENVLEVIEQDQIDRTLTLGNIVYDTVLFAQGFTKIRIYRAAENAGILQALITTIANSNVAGSTVFVETAATFTDTALAHFPAQTTKLGVPPVGMTCIRYHNGRMWGIKGNRLYYSCSEAEVVGELGNAYESWPPQNSIFIKETRGLFIIGGTTGDDTLVVQTASGEWVVSGADRRTIGAVPLPTRDGGTFYESAFGFGSRLIALYADKRVYAFPGEVDLAQPIQDKFDAVNEALLSGNRAHRFTWGSRNFICFSVPKTGASAANDVTYVYDVDGEKWYEWSVGFSAFVTAHAANGALQLWASTPAGESFQLFQPNTWRDRGNDFAPKLKTALQRPAGVGRAEWVDLAVLALFVSDGTLAWSGEFLIDEQADGVGVAFTAVASRHEKQSAQGRRVDWTPSISVRTRASVHQFSMTFPLVNSDAYIELIASDVAAAEASK